MVLRIFYALMLLFSVLFMPFWVTIVLALAGIAYFDFFWEAPLMFLLSDLLYGVKIAAFLNITFVSFIAAAVLLVLAEFLKKKLKFY